MAGDQNPWGDDGDEPNPFAGDPGLQVPTKGVTVGGVGSQGRVAGGGLKPLVDPSQLVVQPWASEDLYESTGKPRGRQ